MNSNSPLTDEASSGEKWLVAALYKFVDQPDFAKLREPLLEISKANGVLGTILLAREGINGTIAGKEAGLRNVLGWLRDRKRFCDLEVKESWTAAAPFYRMKVRLKNEIVTLGAGPLDPANNAGEYVEPEDWNALISDPDVLVVDTRNGYETSIGTFEKAVDPKTSSFRDLPQWVDDNLEPSKHRKVAMFCTGGIRCEKSTALLKSKGFDEVYHLRGGILKYLETVPEEESLWKGECFVFDQRVSVKHGLQQGTYDMCHACRMPLTNEQMQSPLFEPGVSCPICHDRHTAQQRERFAERQRQVTLAKKRGEDHIAADVAVAKEEKRKRTEVERVRSNSGS